MPLGILTNIRLGFKKVSECKTLQLIMPSVSDKEKSFIKSEPTRIGWNFFFCLQGLKL